MQKNVVEKKGVGVSVRLIETIDFYAKREVRAARKTRSKTTSGSSYGILAVGVGLNSV